MVRKARSDSTHAQVMAAQASKEILPPDGIMLVTEEEKTIWRQFSAVRAKEHWRDFDLVLLSKVVKMEVEIRRHQATLDKTGVIMKNQRGTFVENPLLRVLDTIQRQQLAIIRSMSLNSTGTDPRTLNGSGKFGQGEVIDADLYDPMGLLA